MWKKIKQNENYSINEKGEVRNNKTGKIKKAFINKSNGYKMIDLYKDNKSTKHTIHRLIAENFIDNPDQKPTVDHKDGDRLNNSISNLRWATYSEQNSRFETRGVRSERIKVTHFKENVDKRGGKHISWGDAETITFFDRITDVAVFFNCNISNISLMLNKGEIGRRGKMRGYKFEYCKKTNFINA